MLRKPISLFFITLIFAITLCACSNSQSVSVQRADQLAYVGQVTERYAGKVVSDNITSIQRDATKTIKEVNVSVGQEVKAGDILFTYDSESLELELEKQELELEKLVNEQVTYDEQLETLEKQLANTWNDSAKVRLTLEINTLKTTILEAKFTVTAKEKTIEEIRHTLDNTDITSPVDGIVRQLNEEDNGQPYITIQQQGAYRVKGSINEMSIYNGLNVGAQVRAYSRVEAGKFWTGFVSGIDTDDSSQNNNYDAWYGYEDGMNTSTSYVFYVELDSTEGLMLGQHVYVQVAPPEALTGLWIPEAYLFDLAFNEETYETTASVWAANSSNKLEKKSVVLGMYDDMTGSYEIVSGLDEDAYLANPSDSGCAAGASVIFRNVSDFIGDDDIPAVSVAPDDSYMDEEWVDDMADDAVMEEEA